jgi:perosamine synthetase
VTAGAGAGSAAIALYGAEPIRETRLPYGRQQIEDDDVAAVVAALRSDWLTTGPKVGEFEEAFAEMTGARHSVAVSNGTAALHAAIFALDIGPGDEVIVPAMTFAASANCVVYQGGTPRFADVDGTTLLIDVESVEQLVSPRTRAIVAVDYAGQPCDYDGLKAIADRHGIALVADAAHSLGASYRGRRVGTLADLSTFSFHPVKHLTTGEGGMITTDDDALAGRMRAFRNHGITSDHRQRTQTGAFFYEMVALGYNYRLTDFQCALGLSQLAKVPRFLAARRAIASRYHRAFAGLVGARPVHVRNDVEHAYHLFPILLDPDALSADRATVFAALVAEGIGVNVHYIPVHLHPFYRERFNLTRGLCPVAEAAYDQLLTLPLFASMSDDDVEDVIVATTRVVSYFAARP